MTQYNLHKTTRRFMFITCTHMKIKNKNSLNPLLTQKKKNYYIIVLLLLQKKRFNDQQINFSL